MLVLPKSSSAVLVMMRSKSVSICNCSLARLDDRPSSWLVGCGGLSLSPLFLTSSAFRLSAPRYAARVLGLITVSALVGTTHGTCLAYDGIG